MSKSLLFLFMFSEKKMPDERTWLILPVVTWNLDASGLAKHHRGKQTNNIIIIITYLQVLLLLFYFFFAIAYMFMCIDINITMIIFSTYLNTTWTIT